MPRTKPQRIPTLMSKLTNSPSDHSMNAKAFCYRLSESKKFSLPRPVGALYCVPSVGRPPLASVGIDYGKSLPFQTDGRLCWRIRRRRSRPDQIALGAFTLRMEFGHKLQRHLEKSFPQSVDGDWPMVKDWHAERWKNCCRRPYFFLIHGEKPRGSFTVAAIKRRWHTSTQAPLAIWEGHEQNPDATPNMRRS